MRGLDAELDALDGRLCQHRADLGLSLIDEAYCGERWMGFDPYTSALNVFQSEAHGQPDVDYHAVKSFADTREASPAIAQYIIHIQAAFESYLAVHAKYGTPV